MMTTDPTPLRIIRFTAENFKRLRVVDLTPDPDVVTLTGANGAGKSSVLDAIAAALGAARLAPGKPIRNGEEVARIELDLGEVVVKRRFRGDDTQLVVEAANGARFHSPQAVLDKLIGAIAFDPLAFARDDPRKQYETLHALVPLPIDLDALVAADKLDYDARTDAGRQVRSLRAQLDGLPPPAPNAHNSPVDVAALARALSAAGEANAALERRRSARAKATEDVAAHLKEADAIYQALPNRLHAIEVERDRIVSGIDEQIAALQKRKANEISAWTTRLKEEQIFRTEDAEKHRQDAADLQAKIDAAEPLPAPTDTAALAAEIADATRNNAAFEANQRHAAIEKQAAAAEAEVAELTSALETRATTRRNALEATKMPVNGLSLGDGIVMFNGVPFDQASAAERLRVSTAIAMAANPRLRVLCVRDAAILDAASLAALKAATRAGGFQLWLERVDPEEGVGIILEDGQVSAVPTIEGFTEEVSA